MAGSDSASKTEKPTPKRRQEARKEGQIARSVDLVQWVALLAATFVLPAAIGSLLERLARITRRLIEASATGEPGHAYGQLGEVLVAMAMALVPLMAVLLVVTAGGLAAQGGIVLAPKSLKPRWDRVSPAKGFKRLFSAQSLFETGKALVRIVVFGLVIWAVVLGTVRQLLTGTSLNLAAAVPLLGSQLVLALRVAALAGVLIGVADLFYQRHKIEKQLKMSRQEIRQEMKSAEGDPMVRSRRRSAHARLTRNAMLSAVDDASVVVVNPTHVAVALRYVDGEGAPRVVAKGGDELARRIRERALGSGVPVLEVRPLARVLFDTVKVGEHIPEQLFAAVAIVLAYVMRTPRRAWAADVRTLRVPVPVPEPATR